MSEQVPLQMSEIVEVCDRSKSTFECARVIEERSKRTEEYEVAGNKITFTWEISCFDCDGQPCTQPRVAYGPWWAAMERNVPAHLQGAQGVVPQVQIVALARRIETYLKALTPSQKWPDTLAEMGIVNEPRTI